ncbi:Gamma-glutamyltranspeptidase precursor [Stieleria neptunia]|uniref:Glutathione hydrolase proenzyme n=1 Tax=Stieleria neptunia TaxID=2527979 RepID=A0A518HT91_9BACT|nr:Gamma-glutamyltranspeptidase precursor [Stieleria neptunia]
MQRVCQLGWLIVIVGFAVEGSPAFGQALRDAESRDGMVVAVSPDAAAVGAEILQQGGTAVDSAIATAFALAVTHPSAGNLGGGGFMLVYPGDGSPPLMIDYREKAPLAAEREMFVDNNDTHTHPYVGVPGTVRGMKLAHELYGSLAWRALVTPAVALSRDGFEIHVGLAAELNRELGRSTNDEFRRVYGKPDGSDWAVGDRIVLSDLAATLQRIADDGPSGFYAGKTAELIATEMKAGGGLISTDDLLRYRARVRQPTRCRFRGYEVLGPPPPSSGGITLSQMLGIAAQFDLRRWGRWSVKTNHVMIEAMRRAYANRAMYLGDPDFAHIPKHLTSVDFAKYMAGTIDMDQATPSHLLGPPLTEPDESPQTTHFSVIDRDGMAVSNTYTLEASYGSGIVVRGAGFLLNNEMGDFNRRPGVTDTKGSIGTVANEVRPQKRMLSSMTPTIVLKDGKPYLITGSPGGRTIINTVFCVTLNVLEFGMSAREAVDAPRTDHEWFPDRVRFMGADDPEHARLVEQLRQLGHTIVDTNSQGDANTILVSDGSFIGAADYRYGAAIAPGGNAD